MILFCLCNITCHATRGFKSSVIMYMTNPTVPYSLIHIDEYFTLRYVKGLQHLLKCGFVRNTTAKGWILGWVGLQKFKLILHLYLTDSNVLL